MIRRIFTIQFFRYAIVGAIGTLGDIALLYFLYEYLHLSLLFATAVSAFFGAIINFTINHFWTFSTIVSQKFLFYRRLLKFFTVSSIAICLNVILMWGLVDFLHWYYLFSKIIITLSIFLLHYILNSLWTFQQKNISPFFSEEADSVHDCDISIVIPVYNESKRIIPTLESIFSFFKNTTSSYEVIIVDDGSSDETVTVIQSHFLNQCKIFSFEKNKGKGAAVKKGVLESKGKNILFMDADGSTAIDQLLLLLPQVKNHHIVIGSRYTDDADLYRSQGVFRRTIGRFANFFIQLFFIEGVIDSQCGFKLFRGDIAKKLFSLQKIKRFGFDIEILLLAKKYNFLIKEVGVRWENDNDSRFHPFYDTLFTAGEFIRIKWMMMRGKYDL